MNQLLNVGDAARLLRLSPHTLYRWVIEGRVPTVRLGRRLLFDPVALRAWVLDRSRLGSSATGTQSQVHSAVRLADRETDPTGESIGAPDGQDANP